MREMNQTPPPRFSIKTQKNIKQCQQNSNKYYCSLISIVFVSACIIAIIFEISKPPQTQISFPNTDAQHAKQENLQILMVQGGEHIKQINNSFSLSIPVVNSKQNKCQKNRKIQLQQSLNNIKIFQLLHRTVADHQNVLQRYFIKVMPLYVIKHVKFTSPSGQAKISVTDLNWWNPFYDSEGQNYKGVNKIFQTNNQDKWVSSGKYLTVVSDQPIKPTYIIMNIPGGQTLRKTLYIFGLSASQTMLTNQHTLQSTFIKKTSLQVGRNQIQCDLPECAAEYSMIMFIFDPVQIITLQIYTRKPNL